MDMASAHASSKSAVHQERPATHGAEQGHGPRGWEQDAVARRRVVPTRPSPDQPVEGRGPVPDQRWLRAQAAILAWDRHHWFRVVRWW